MYDWTDTLAINAAQSFPNLRFHIWQALDHGDIDQLLDLLLNLEVWNATHIH